MLESVVDRDHRRAEEDDEQRGEDARQEREDNLHRDLLCLLFCALPALRAHLGSLHVKHLGDGDTEDVGLDHRQDERLELGDARSVTQVAQRVGAALAELHLLKHAVELLAERPALLAGDARKRCVEAETGLNRDRQEVERGFPRPTSCH